MNTMRTAMLLAFLTALFMAIGYLIGGTSGMFIALIFAAGTNLFSYWNADKIILRLYNAHEVNAHQYGQLHKIVSDLAKNAGLPQPKIYVIENEQPNAFATGRNPQNAAVAATTGLLKRLNAQEISAVMAHELAHIQNRDTLTMTITATLAGAITMIGNFALFSGMSNRNNDNGHGGGHLLISLISLMVAPMAAGVVQMAISRAREYGADYRGSQICGNPLWLVSALKKIAANVKTQENEIAEENPTTAPMFIINPLSGRTGDNLFSTHPATQNRINALLRLAKEMNIVEHPDGPIDERQINAHQRPRTAKRPQWLNKIK